jgi:hypothetical protein
MRAIESYDPYFLDDPNLKSGKVSLVSLYFPHESSESDESQLMIPTMT